MRRSSTLVRHFFEGRYSAPNGSPMIGSLRSARTNITSRMTVAYCSEPLLSGIHKPDLPHHNREPYRGNETDDGVHILARPLPVTPERSALVRVRRTAFPTFSSVSGITEAAPASPRQSPPARPAAAPPGHRRLHPSVPSRDIPLSILQPLNATQSTTPNNTVVPFPRRARPVPPIRGRPCHGTQPIPPSSESSLSHKSQFRHLTHPHICASILLCQSPAPRPRSPRRSLPRTPIRGRTHRRRGCPCRTMSH